MFTEANHAKQELRVHVIQCDVILR